jgi:hypothetical protein
MTEVEIDDTDDEEERDDPAEFRSALAEMVQRATAVGIKYEQGQDEEGEPTLVVRMPDGRDSRPVHVHSLARAKSLLSIPFEEFVFLSPYEAVCSYRAGTIESFVRPAGTFASLSRLRRSLHSLAGPASPTPSYSEWTPLSVSKNGVTLVLGGTSPTLRVLCRGNAGMSRYAPGLRVSGLTIARHDDAVALVERLANALFFDLDLRFEMPLVLERARTGVRRTRAPSSASEGAIIEFPRSEFDAEPMALYWYARSALLMPLLQYLAFYQVLEFYFPRYAQVEAHRRVKNVLRSPLFSIHSDADVTRVLSAAQGVAGRSPEEQAQLRSTVAACIDEANLRSFIAMDARREEFLSKSKELGVHRLPLSAPNTDLTVDVAARVYDIRCKIVHTKAGSADAGSLDLLLPFSKEADLLWHDVALIEYVARQVLIASSRAL